jgi:hypothetical protein
VQQKPPIFYSHNELHDMNRDRRKRINFLGALILFVIVVVGLAIFFIYGSKSNQLPLPSSAKTISANTIQIPFPYSESQNGEAWNLITRDQDRILKITNKGKAVVDIPLSNSPTAFYVTKLGKSYLGGYRYNTNTTIQLGNKVYKITEIDLNSDNTSGKVILEVNS